MQPHLSYIIRYIFMSIIFFPFEPVPYGASFHLYHIYIFSGIFFEKWTMEGFLHFHNLVAAGWFIIRVCLNNLLRTLFDIITQGVKAHCFS